MVQRETAKLSPEFSNRIGVGCSTRAAPAHLGKFLNGRLIACLSLELRRRTRTGAPLTASLPLFSGCFRGHGLSQARPRQVLGPNPRER